jgi:hypothetical protein
MTKSHKHLPTLEQYYNHSDGEVHPHIEIVPFRQKDAIPVNLTITVKSVKNVVMTNPGKTVSLLIPYKKNKTNVISFLFFIA